MTQPNLPSESSMSDSTDIVGYELTFWCLKHRPLLNDDSRLDVLTHCLTQALEYHEFVPGAHAFLPDCVHLVILRQNVSAGVERFLYTLKRNFTHWIKQVLNQTDRLEQRTLTLREGPGRYVFRFWEAGPGQIRPLRNRDELIAAIDSTHNAPVKFGLCHEPGLWRWSSWQQYHTPHQGITCASKLPPRLRTCTTFSRQDRLTGSLVKRHSDSETDTCDYVGSMHSAPPRYGLNAVGIVMPPLAF